MNVIQRTTALGNVLGHVSGNKTRVAQILGIDRKTLRAKLLQAGAAGDRPSEG